MLSPQEANTMIGERIALRSIGRPGSRFASWRASLLPTNRFSTIQWISCSFMKWIAAPPLLEFEEAFARLLGLREQVVILAEIVAARVELLEVADEMGAVEHAVAEVGEKERRQRAAEQAAVVAHRVLAEAAGPVGDRRAVDDQRPADVGVRRRHDQARPAALAVADDDRLGRVRVELADLGDEGGFGAHHVGERLARLRMRAEHDEIDRVAVVQRDADLAVRLEAADAGAVAGARVDDHVGALPVLDLDSLGRQDLSSTLLVGRGRVLPSRTTS